MAVAVACVVKYSMVTVWLLRRLRDTTNMAGLSLSRTSVPAIETLGRPSSSMMAPTATPSSTVALVGWPSWSWNVSSGSEMSSSTVSTSIWTAVVPDGKVSVPDAAM